jgi:aspartyl-tRNA(Asn)/glutamyl-tRNA(Gln) amidotransferase subunit C
LSTTSPRRLREASPSISVRVTAAVESRSSHSSSGASRLARRLRANARALCAAGPDVHIQRQADDKARALTRVVKLQDRLGVGGELGAADLLEGRRDEPRRVADGHADALLAGVKAHQRAACGQRGGEIGEVEERQAALLWTAGVSPASTGACRRDAGGPYGLNLRGSAFKPALMSIDEKTVRKVAKLARLALPEERVKPMAAELNGIMAWIEQLNEVDIDGVEPMTSAVEGLSLPMREDVVTEGADPARVLQNAPKTEDGFFVVPKVVE